jgi:hypothetical protein
MQKVKKKNCSNRRKLHHKMDVKKQEGFIVDFQKNKSLPKTFFV